MRFAGSCHCGAVRFEFDAEPITAGVRCNCSLCARRGALMSASWLEDLAITGREALTLYLWGDRMVNHYFCRTCGVFPFSQIIAEPGRFRVNLGCVDGVDLDALSVRLIDGKSL